LNGSVEAQRWWPVAPAIRMAGAVFIDLARTASRVDGPARNDVDVGAGARLAVATLPGIFRVDLGKGVQDGDFAISLTYVP
jgi:hypothetical protein